MTTLLSAPLVGQIINLFAAVLLLLSFAMLSQRRILSLIDLFAAQGLVLAASTAFVAWAGGQHHLYVSAGITLVLKVLLLPWALQVSGTFQSYPGDARNSTVDGNNSVTNGTIAAVDPSLRAIWNVDRATFNRLTGATLTQSSVTIMRKVTASPAWRPSSSFPSLTSKSMVMAAM